MKGQQPILLLSVDVEDWFHVDNLKSAISRESWNVRELRVERNVNGILEMLAAANTKATFFILGWVAEQLPDLVKHIHAAGHEVAAHGYGHELVYDLTPETFRRDVGRSKAMLEDLTGSRVIGYRAPNFSITDWAIDVLAELGFRYDSSLYPTKVHDRYGTLAGIAASPEPVLQVRDGFFEVLLSCLPMFRYNIPWSGGAYFRMIPYPLFKRGIEAIVRKSGTYCFYIHPWEFDPGQPRVPNVKLFYRMRHYTNLRKTQARFTRLVQDFNFAPLRQVLP